MFISNYRWILMQKPHRNADEMHYDFYVAHISHVDKIVLK